MKKVFLLADDDFDDAELFQEALSEVAPSTIFYHAQDGQEALDKLADKSLERPHIIFLDLNMPGMNGWQFLAKLKDMEAYRNIPVIIYSTASQQREVDIAIDLGALCFFTKPRNFKELKTNLKIITDNLNENLQEAILELKGIKCNKS